MFEELKKLKGTQNSFSSKIDHKSNPEDISDHFSDIYRELFNRTESKQPMFDLLREVNANIIEDDLMDVDLVTSDLISKILKEKIKLGKNDSEFNVTTDALKNGPPELSEHIASFL